MLKIYWKPHRSFLRANAPEPQKLFALLKLSPELAVAATRPTLAWVLVVDVSSSMSGEKIESSVAATHALVDDIRLQPDDFVAVISFQQEAQTLLPLTKVRDKDRIHHAIDQLQSVGGSTMMGKGLEKAALEMRGLPIESVKRLLLISDGDTPDAVDCLSHARNLARMEVSITAIGVGDKYNEFLLSNLAEATRGRPYALTTPHLLNSILNAEVGYSTREVVTALSARVSMVKGVCLESLARVYPEFTTIPIAQTPYPLGNVRAGDQTIFLAEFTVSEISRPPSAARVAQLTLSSQATATGEQQEFEPRDLRVTFTSDEAQIGETDLEVLSYVQQKSVDQMIRDAMRSMQSQPDQSRQTLHRAVNVTRSMGNSRATKLIEDTLAELETTGRLSAEMRKTVLMGRVTSTIKTISFDEEEEEQLRLLSGA